MDVYRCLKGLGGEKIKISNDLISASRKCIDAMLRLGQWATVLPIGKDTVHILFDTRREQTHPDKRWYYR